MPFINPRPLLTRSSAAIAAAALSAAVTFMLLLPALASAASGADPSTPKDPDAPSTPGGLLGDRVANLITDFTKPLLVAVAGMMSFAAFGKRDTGRVLTVLMVTTVIGGFVYAGGAVQVIIEQIWTQVQP